MASRSETTLQTAVSAVENAMARLDAAAAIAAQTRTQSASQRESIQDEISQSWQEHSSQLEVALMESQSENTFLKEDNLRLSNQLQQLQQEYLTLQTMAGATVGTLDRTIKQLDLMLEH